MATVWVLGAGFSKGLGGPLLPQLLAPETELYLDAAYSRDDYPALFHPSAQVARVLYNYGINFERGPINLLELGRPPQGARFWDDAEQFLDTLDSSVADTTGMSRAARFLDRYIGQFHGMVDRPREKIVNRSTVATAARRLMAAECSMFLDRIALASERFHPYVRWADALGVGDTIISFNYDRVVEEAFAVSSNSKPFVVVLPTKGEIVLPSHNIELLKLHGSVDWQRRADRTIQASAVTDFALKCADSEMVIASPGATKQTVTKELQPLWDRASVALHSAERIVFVGYSFPATDAHAREALLAAVLGNTYGPSPLRLEIVLGPNTAQAATVRLKAMLERTGDNRGRSGRAYTVKVHPLLGEDFFTMM